MLKNQVTAANWWRHH